MNSTTNRPRYVPGEGPVPAKVMLIGEGPGDTENKYGRPFCGPSGELLNTLLRQNGLDREAVYVTNLVKFQVPDNDDPTHEDIARDARELREEIASVKPQFVGLLGRCAARHFLGAEIDLEWAHGLAFGGYGRSWMPMYHPAFGLHSVEMLPRVQYDVMRFSQMVKGKILAAKHADACPKPKYDVLEQKVSFLPGPVYIDTEGSAEKPWGLSFTQHQGIASVILAKDKAALRRFAQALKGHVVVLHNAMHDIPVLRAMGIEFAEFRDTMIRAYHLGIEPQGLKPLARRHAGMEMDSYDDVIAEARKSKGSRYFEEALVWLAKHWVEESETFSKAKAKKVSKRAGTGSRKTSRQRPRSLSPKSVTSRRLRSTTSR